MEKRKAAIFKLLLAGLACCGIILFTLPAADLVPFSDITPAQAAALIAEKGADPLFTILDVRTPAEFAEGRIKGALNIDVKAVDFKEKIEKLEKNGIYLAYCKGGVRSGRAMSLMKEAGFKQVYNLAGGLMKWQEEKLPLETTALPVTAPLSCGTTAPTARVMGPSPGSYAWLDGKKAAAIPFRLFRNHVHIDAEINGTKKLDLILDTGMPAPGVLLFAGAAVQALNLPYAGEAMIAGAGGGTSPAKIAAGVSLKIGDLLLKEQTALVKTADPAEASPIDQNLGTNGVIGFALFSRFVVAIDYDRMLLTLSEPADFSYQGQGTAVPIDVTTHFPFIDCTARLEDGKSVSLKMIVDLGASHALSLNIGSQPEIQAPQKTSEFRGKGAGGEVKGRLGRIVSLSIGKFELKNPVAGFYATKLMPLEKDGNLGNDALRRFNLVFDYSRRALIIEPNSHFNEPFEAAMSGFQAEKNSAGEFVVSHVIENSPASEVKLQENDRIVEVNGAASNSISLDDLSRASTRDGGSLDLAIRRGDARFTVSLKLRRLI